MFMLAWIRKSISWFFRWGEHAQFARDLLEFFAVKKTVISALSGIVAVFESWREGVHPVIIGLVGLAVFVLALVAINVGLWLCDRVNSGSRLGGHWPDFRKWDQREKFELYEAACLWFDREPVLPMPRNAQKKYQEWKQIILKRNLSVTGPTLDDDIKISMKEETAINPYLIIRRDELEKVARHDHVEPRFLFRNRRGEI